MRCSAAALVVVDFIVTVQYLLTCNYVRTPRASQQIGCNENGFGAKNKKLSILQSRLRLKSNRAVIICEDSTFYRCCGANERWVCVWLPATIVSCILFIYLTFYGQNHVREESCPQWIVSYMPTLASVNSKRLVHIGDLTRHQTDVGCARASEMLPWELLFRSH